MKPHLIPLFLGLLVVAFALGRHTARAPDETLEEHTREEIALEEAESLEETAVVEHAAAEEATERTEATTERVRVVWRERIVQADGATAEREMELDAETARLLHEAEARREEVVSLRLQLDAARSSAAMMQAAHDLRRELRTPLPDWRVGAMIGVDLSSPGPAYGLTVERRILGPIHVGAWGLSAGSAGLSVGVSF